LKSLMIALTHNPGHLLNRDAARAVEPAAADTRPSNG
jgi:hypothetical protein